MNRTARRCRPWSISSEQYLTLMADSDGVGFVHCGDSVLVVPLTDNGEVLMAVERSPAFDREVLLLAGGEVGGTGTLGRNREPRTPGGTGLVCGAA